MLAVTNAHAQDKVLPLAPLPQAEAPASMPTSQAAETAQADLKAAVNLNTSGVNILTSAPTSSVDSFREMLEATYTSNPRILAERQALQVTDEGMASAASGFRPSAAYGLETG
ncbi:MAG: hypothetical protein ACK52W_01520, partial [Alphaproteobacteria bacterium]